MMDLNKLTDDELNMVSGGAEEQEDMLKRAEQYGKAGDTDALEMLKKEAAKYGVKYMQELYETFETSRDRSASGDGIGRMVY